MNLIRQIFSFTKPERNGLSVLALAVILLTAYFSFAYFSESASGIYPDVPASPNTASSNNAEVRIKRREKPEREFASLAGTHSVYQQHELFYFNPNGLSAEEWVKLGLSPAQAQSVKNFEAKGGKFRTKEDLKKLYVISPQKYLELEPYVSIPSSVDSSRTAPVKYKPAIIELNIADTSQLVRVNGIGPVFASRIVAYRERLGGFHHKEQLKEVFGIDDEKYALINESFRVDSAYIRKMNVNTALASDLKKHPYLSPGTANAIVNYRKQHGLYKQLRDIMKCHLVSEELYRKIAPYLTI